MIVCIVLVIVLLGVAHDLFEFLMAEATIGHHFNQLRKGHIKSAHNGYGLLIHLADFFFQRHAGQ